ncbi:MAG TPA: hypothetical protein DEF59_04160 [Candidatus Magasanikbacteria bacterium]|nr:hypothetical protein [Candidatus Magasanikbacteria bacterium]
MFTAFDGGDSEGKMKSFATLWVGLSARLRLRFATAGVVSVAEEIIGLPSAERGALLAAVDHKDAPDALVRRTALVRAYINTNFGGIPEERALEAEIEASIGLDMSASNVAPADKPAVPTLPIPGKVAMESPVATPSADEKTPVARAREAHEIAVAAANAATPARKPERIVPRPIVAEKRKGVPLETHQRLREARVVMSVTALKDLLREGRCCVSGKRFHESDKVTLVNHKLLASYELVREFGRDNGWSWISVPLAEACLVDWEDFVEEVIKEKMVEKRLAVLRARLETEEDRRHDVDTRDDDLTITYFWCHLLKVAIGMEEYGIKHATADAECERNAESLKKARVALEEELRMQFTSRKIIKARQKLISSRHAEIKAELDALYASIMEAGEKSVLRASLKSERDKLGQEFEIISSFWGDLPEEQLAATFHVTDSARKVPVVRSPGKTARKHQKGGATQTASTSIKKPTTPEEREAKRKASEEAAKAKKAQRRKDAEATRVRRNEPHFGEAKKGGGEAKKGKSATTDGKVDRRADKKSARLQH